MADINDCYSCSVSFVPVGQATGSSMRVSLPPKQNKIEALLTSQNSHTKEHMLVGLKTHLDSSGALIWPSWVNRGLDTDVIVSEVRETSRKPDEAYGMIDRMCPGGRKVGELVKRPEVSHHSDHTIHPFRNLWKDA